MRIAVIDLGTNSVRFDVHQFGPGRVVRTLHRDKIMIRLGQGVFTHGQLDSDAIDRTVHAFHGFKKIATDLRVSRILALGTSALREAVDAPKLVARVKKSTGIDVRVISGPEEARLIALGILSNERGFKGRVGLIDIGGGSTEITIAQRRDIVKSDSFALGTARLQQVFLKRSPPTSENVDELRVYVRRTLAEQIVAHDWPKPQLLVGSSGTIKALAKILKKKNGKKSFKLKDLSELIKRMRKMNTTQLLGIQGMESKRVDMILAGAVLLEECMLALKVDEFKTTDFSLRDGILEEQIELSKQHLTSQIGLHLPDLCEKAAKLGQSRKHLDAIVAMSEQLFKSLSRLHKLDRGWRMYLDAAAILRNTGEAISVIGNAEHSAYIVRNSKFPFFEEWESDFVAELCRHHERHKLDVSLVPFNGNRKTAFLRILAILSLIDALDVDPKSPAQIRRVHVNGDHIRITLSGGTSSDLEALRVEQRKQLFKTVFRRVVQVQRV